MSIVLENNGLTTVSAMKKLVNQIETELNDCKCISHGFKGFKIWLKESFSHSSLSSTFQWPSVLLLLVCSTAFMVLSYEKNDSMLFYESIFLYFILIMNIILVGSETKLRHQEIHSKARLLASKIRNSLLIKDNLIVDEWKTGKYYPHIHSPQSPCISLQWTFRDNIQVNLPSSLLVKGDIILISPGHVAPGHCQSIKLNNSEKVIELKKGDYFALNQNQNYSSFNNARVRKAAKPVKFRLLETPFIPLLRLTLDKSCKRPVTSYEKERFAIMVKYVEHLIAPFLLVVCLSISLVHYYVLANDNNKINFKKKNFEWIFLRPSMVILPLLPLMSPVSWILLNAFGYAKLYLATKLEEEADKPNKFSTGLNWSPSNTANKKMNNDKAKDNKYDFDEELGSNISSNSNETDSFNNVKNFDLLLTMKKLLLNQDESLWRSANLLQVFGSITALSCVDKKGLLSTPNPSADKVFFLNSMTTEDKSDKTDSQNLVSSDNEVKKDETENNNSKSNKLNSSFKAKNNSKFYTKAEVLDVTPDSRTMFGLQFDDPEWHRYLPNLKPLGLAILLNTCNFEAQEEYSQFCNHIEQESLLNETSVPVVNKRCLCEFARQIGFTNAATNDYNYLFQLCSFRHIKPEIIQQGKLAKSLNLPKLKMPFPNMSSAIIKDNYSNSYFLFSQGTCDLILDTCSEFWDGEDLCLLSETDKKHILDFYHRSSLTAACIAFAYVPLSKSIEKKILEDQYIEFPPDTSHLFKSQKNLKFKDDNEQKTLQSHHLSTDSLTVKENEEQIRPKSNSSNHSYDGQNIDSILSQLCNQVFIGMVTMQYHPCPDFVQLVEDLEKACVRFVHFSKENELRSRVFSEKMGLESGWNCHISLLSDKIINCENPNCRLINCDGTLCVNKNENKSPLTLKTSSNINYSSPNSFLMRSQSAPSYFNMDSSITNLEKNSDSLSSCKNLDISKRLSNTHESGFKISYEDTDSDDTENSKLKFIDESANNELKQLLSNSPSYSHFSDSIAGNSTVPIAFDISNRAKLPKGIENIRPHLENVDNVPLLVSLFTDCTSETTCEMIKIMQEHGEVVCVLGSSSNLSNIPIFLQADTSIGIQPLYPQVCITTPVTESNGEIPFKNFISPIDLSRELISLPCALHFHREDTVSLSKLICYCRNFMMNARNYIQFYVSCCLSLALAQFCSSLLLLPPLFSPGHLLWCSCFVIPILSYSLMGIESDPSVMSLAMGKNLNLSKSSILYFLLCYLFKFSISAIVVVFNFSMFINNYNYMPNSKNNSNRYFFMIDSKEEILNDFDNWSSYLFFCQTFSVFFFVLYFVVISLGFVYRSHLLWQKSPLKNKFWFITSILILLIHFLYCISILHIFIPDNLNYYISYTPSYISIVSLIWPLPLITFNSLVKKRELKIYQRQQRRARLEFGTKLGMNSPF